MTEIFKECVLSKAFPDKLPIEKTTSFSLIGSLTKLTASNCQSFASASPFANSGIMINRDVHTRKYRAQPIYARKVLADILVPEKDVPEIFFISKKEIGKWRKRRSRNGTDRRKFPDPIGEPSRTILTGEGTRSPSWHAHIISTGDGRHRRLMPVELERLNMFPDNHTKEATDVQRAFLMGNALVIGIVELIGRKLAFEHFRRE